MVYDIVYNSLFGCNLIIPGTLNVYPLV